MEPNQYFCLDIVLLSSLFENQEFPDLLQPFRSSFLPVLHEPVFRFVVRLKGVLDLTPLKRF